MIFHKVMGKTKKIGVSQPEPNESQGVTTEGWTRFTDKLGVSTPVTVQGGAKSSYK